MQGIEQYIISILAVSITTSVVMHICGKRKAISALIRTLGSIIVVLSILSPLLRFEFENISLYLAEFKLDSDKIVEEAKNRTKADTTKLISDQIQTYIKNKADRYGANIAVSVTLAEPECVVPETITIEGQVSPYTKRVLQNLIANDLGVLEENQIWQ